jgi:hypothetical protein
MRESAAGLSWSLLIAGMMTLGGQAPPARAQSGQGAPAFEVPSFIGAHSLKELQQARSALESAARSKRETQDRLELERRLAEDADAKRRAEEERRAAAEAEVKRKAEEVRRLSALEAEAKRKLSDEKRLLEEENAAKRRADERFRRLTSEPPPAAAAVGAANPKEGEAPATAAPADAAPATGNGSEPARRSAAVLTAAPPQPGKTCPAATVAGEALSAGRMRVNIASPCRAGQTVVVAYGPFKASGRIDADGYASIPIDLFLGGSAAVTAGFEDGTSRVVAVASRDLDRVSKVAVLWREPVNLDLHAYEYTARGNDAGHVWAGATQSAEEALQAAESSGRGHGFMSTRSDASVSGDKLEVYTLWQPAGEAVGVVTMALDYETRGDVPKGETCGEAKLASIPVMVWRLRRGEPAAEREDRLLSPQPCGQALSHEVRFNPDSMPHLTIR